MLPPTPAPRSARGGEHASPTGQATARGRPGHTDAAPASTTRRTVSLPGLPWFFEQNTRRATDVTKVADRHTCVQQPAKHVLGRHLPWCVDGQPDRGGLLARHPWLGEELTHAS